MKRCENKDKDNSLYVNKVNIHRHSNDEALKNRNNKDTYIYYQKRELKFLDHRMRKGGLEKRTLTRQIEKERQRSREKQRI